MNASLIKTLLSRFDKFAFKKFTEEFFEKTDTELNHLSEIQDDDVYYHPLLDSYGDSLHSVYIFNYIPIEILKKSLSLKIDTEKLKLLLSKIGKHYKNKTGYWGMVSPELKKDHKLQSIGFLTNFSGYSEEDYQKLLFPHYKKLVFEAKMKIYTLLVGSYDSFIDKNYEKVLSTFENLFSSYIDGLSINLSQKEFQVDYFTQEKNLTSGVFSGENGLYEPVFIKNRNDAVSILSEFSKLIAKDTSEAKMEAFLREYYKLIFGFKYDKIETQLWLKFPELDIRNKNRKLDIFLRNSVENDWELFEIKKPSIKLTKTYRDIPAFCNQITSAKQQLRNYKKILDNDSIKRKFASSGIKYFEPSLRLVVGRTPSISLDEWRWLKASNLDDVKIITYDDLIKEMSIRLNDRELAINQKSNK